MQYPDFYKLRRSITLFIVLAASIFILISSSLIIYIQYTIQEKHEEEYARKLNQNIEHVIRHNISEYTFLASRITKTVDLANFIENSDRKGLQHALQIKWMLLKKANNYLNVMQIHLKNGKSFLRMHSLENYGDDIAQFRPMLQYIHKSHKFISGYEIGKFASAYRVIEPIFNKKGDYIGAFEVGVDPNILLPIVHDINNLDGAVFIDDKSLSLFNHKKNIVVDNYRLQSKMIPQLKEIIKCNQLANDLHIMLEDKVYRTYLYTLKDFAHKEKVKLIFFQDITNISFFNSDFFYVLFLLIVTIFPLLIWFVYRRINTFEDGIAYVYKKQILALGESKQNLKLSEEYLQSIFDVIPSIMIISNGSEIEKVNPAMLQFFAYDTLEEFKREHRCICDFFIPNDSCVVSNMDGIDWLGHILSNEAQQHYVCMMKDMKQHYFSVQAHLVNIGDLKRSLVSFYDITKQKELELKLLESQQTYLDFFEYTKSANIIYTTDDNGQSFKIKWLNASVERLENVKREDIIGKDIEDIFEGAEAFGIIKILRAVYLSGESHKMPVTKYKSKDSETWRENYIFKLSNGDVVASYNDRSEEKKAQLLMDNTINSSDNFIFVKDNNFIYITCNSAFERFLGKAHDEIMGRSDYELFDKETADFFRKNDIEMMNSQAVCKNYEWVVYPDGSKHYLLTIKSPLKDDEGNILGLVGNSANVTENKLLQDELLVTKNRFESFMENIPALITIKDKNNKIIYANKMFHTYFHQKNLVGLYAHEFTSEKTAKIVYEMSEEVKEKGFSEKIIESNDKYQNRTYRAMSFFANKDNLQIGSMYFDITKQYKDQHDVIKFKEIIERSPISIVVTDINGNLEYVNTWFTKTTGYTYDEVIGQNPRILKSDFHNQQDYQELWDEITNNQVWAGTFKNIKKNGDEYWESAIIAPLRNSDGVITNFIGIKQEITQQIYLKRELADKEEIMIAQSRHAAMGEMIGMIAHQWRQPISVIAMGANNMLVDIELEDVNEDSFKDLAEGILQQTEYLSKTIDDFRNFFKPDKEMEEVKLGDIMEDAKKIIGKSLENNSIELNITHNSNLSIKTYSRELLQVYINLLKNSKEALVENTLHNRYINVVISDYKDSIITSVCDNGGGVSEEIIDKIFDPYFSTKDEKTGTGLGLYMSKTIIDKHLRGTISVSNTDEGACFKILIPL